MSRPRKTFISDAYAARQAAFAKLGVGMVVSPLKHFRTAWAKAQHNLMRGSMAGFAKDSAEMRVYLRDERRAHLYLEHATWLAKQGHGGALQNCARRQFT